MEISETGKKLINMSKTTSEEKNIPKEKKEQSLKLDYIIEKPNPLLMITNNLTITQSRLFEAFLSKINPQKDVPPYHVKFYLKEFYAALQIHEDAHKKRTNEKMKAVGEEIGGMKFEFTLYDKTQTSKPDYAPFKVISLFESFEYDIDENGGYFEITTTRPFEKMIRELNKYGYVSYYWGNVFLLPSTRKKRFYDFLVKFKKNRIVLISVQKLKEYLGISESEYPLPSIFLREVVKKDIQAINDLTNLSVKYKALKEKGKTTKIQFIVQSKPDYILPRTSYDSTPTVITNNEPFKILFPDTTDNFEMEIDFEDPDV